MHRQRQLEFEAPRSKSPRRRSLKTLRQEFEEARRMIGQFSPTARFNQANRELLQQRRQD